jgi:hypothetical protein
VTKLAVEALLAAHPGVIDLSFERSPRGAILGIHAVVRDERTASELRESVEKAVGGRFAQDRLEIVIEKKEGDAEEKAAPQPKPTTTAPAVALPPKPVPAPVTTSSPLDLPAGRIRLSQVASNVRPGRTTIEVSLERDGQQATSSAEGPSYSGASVNLAAVATFQAVSKLLPSLEGRVDHAGPLSVSGERVVFVALSIKARPDAEWKRLHGISALHEGTPEAAAARAVLGSLNRLLEPR